MIVKANCLPPLPSLPFSTTLQIVNLGLTTNERINFERYHHFKRTKKTGEVKNPFQ